MKNNGLKCDYCHAVNHCIWAMILAGLLIVATRQASAQNSPLFEITSPASGTIVSPGQAITLTLTSPAGIPFTQAYISGETPLGFSGLATSLPAQLSIQIPNGIASRKYLVSATGITRAGQSIKAEPITVDIERPDFPTRLVAEPPNLIFQSQGEQIPIRLWASFADGSFIDVTESSNVVLSSPAGGVASIDNMGIVTAVGNGSGSISLTYSLASQLLQISLPVRVPVPPVTFSSTGLQFGPQDVDTTTPPQPLTITNTGNFPLGIHSIESTGDFTETNNCVPSIAPGAACVIDVMFTPQANGQISGTLSINENMALAPLTVTLAGIGVGPVITVAPTRLTFSGQTLGATSTSQAVMLTNTGSAPLVVTSVSPQGDFSETDNCITAPLAPATACTINVSFTPTSGGIRDGSILIAAGAVSARAISVVGLGSAPIIVFSQAGLTFNGELVQTTSVPQPITLTNLGDVQLTIAGVRIAGVGHTDFSETDNCAPSLAPGASCIVNVSFSPSAAGQRTAALAVNDNAGASPQTISLIGVGTDFSVTSSGSTAVTITAGQSAKFDLQLTPLGGFTGAVAIDCGGAPASSTCVTSPPSVVLNGVAPGTFSVTISTTARSSTSSLPLPLLGRWSCPNCLFVLCLAVSITALALLWRCTPKARVSPLAGAALFTIILLGGCGGGSTSGSIATPIPSPTPSPTPTPTGTPAGTYILVVAATVPGASRTVQLSVTVK